MDILVVLALVVGAAVCFLPGIMAWHHYFGGSKRTVSGQQSVSRRKAVVTTKQAASGHVI